MRLCHRRYSQAFALLLLSSVMTRCSLPSAINLSFTREREREREIDRAFMRCIVYNVESITSISISCHTRYGRTYHDARSQSIDVCGPAIDTIIQCDFRGVLPDNVNSTPSLCTRFYALSVFCASLFDSFHSDQCRNLADSARCTS